MKKRVVVELEKTCYACPSQWEGRTDDGGYVYVRYRHGGLSVGFGGTLEDAIDDDTIYREIGDGDSGFMDADELKAAVPEVVWPF